MSKLTEKDFFFCYSKKVSAYLTYKGVNFITKAINPRSNTMYSLYVKDDELQQALDTYKVENPQQN